MYQSPQDSVNNNALAIARLMLIFKLNEGHLSIRPPNSCHDKFFLNNTAEAKNASAVSNKFSLTIVQDEQEVPGPRRFQLCKNETFSFFRISEGGYEFSAERQKRPYRIRINEEFTLGSMHIDLKPGLVVNFYPLQTVGIVFFSNWLATLGDIILHAGGISHHNEGYAFLGNSGAGKSTLIENLTRQEDVTVLGEDQVVLRWLDGKFWIFGTPWHERPEMCNPLGVPLKKLFILNRQADKVIEQAGPIDLVKTIMSTAFIPFYRPDVLPKILERLDLLADHIPSYYLKYELASDILPIVIDQ